MRKIIVILVMGIILIICGLFSLTIFYQNAEKSYQQDVDILRLEHLEFWTQIVEDYHDKTGYYPLQQSLEKKDSIGLIRIATKNQQQYFDKNSSLYLSKLDNNVNNFFQEFTVENFVSEIENILGKDINERYDIQKVPTDSIIWYNYFVTEKGYLVWVPCITCGVTEISTLTMDGITPTVNIVSEGMLNDVPKSLVRKNMLNHHIYKNWKSRGIKKEEFLRSLEGENFDNSKRNLSKDK